MPFKSKVSGTTDCKARPDPQTHLKKKKKLIGILHNVLIP